MKKTLSFLFVTVLLAINLCGCKKYGDTVQTCKVCYTPCTEAAELEKASEPETLSIDKAIYASIHFIESPKESEFTVTWKQNGDTVQSQTQTTTKDCQDILVYTLDESNLESGSLILEVSYKDTIIYTKELTVL